MVCILLSFAVRVHDSQAYRKVDVTRERISRILELREILLSFQTGFNLVDAAVVCAILKPQPPIHTPVNSQHTPALLLNNDKTTKQKEGGGVGLPAVFG